MLRTPQVVPTVITKYPTASGEPRTTSLRTSRWAPASKPTTPWGPMFAEKARGKPVRPGYTLSVGIAVLDKPIDSSDSLVPSGTFDVVYFCQQWNSYESA